MKKVIGFLIIYVIILFQFLYQQGWLGSTNKSFHPITIEEMNKRIGDNENILVFITKHNCSECSNLMSKLNRVLKHMELEMFYLDLDMTNNIGEKEIYTQPYEITEVPTIIYYENGEFVFNITGNLDEKTIKQYLSITK